MTPDATEPTDADSPADAPAGIPAGGDFAEARREQLLTAPGADERDAAPRIDVTEVAPNTKRIDVRADAAFRPGH